MDNSEYQVNNLIIKLNKIRRELKFSRNDFALLFNVSKFTIDSWFKRNVTPDPTNSIQIFEFLSEIEQIHNAIGIFVVNNKLTTTDPLKIRLIANRHWRNNRLKLICFKTFSNDGFSKVKDIIELVDPIILKDNKVTDLIFYSKNYSLKNYLISQFKENGVRVFHNIYNKTFSIDKSISNNEQNEMK